MNKSFPQETGVEPTKIDVRKVEKTHEKREKSAQQSSDKQGSSAKKGKIYILLGILGIFAGVALSLSPFWLPKKALSELTFPKIPSSSEDDNIYSKLTGEAVSTGVVNAPTYCVQVPNGNDGARPQAGLTGAGVIFEAIAEAGITRFAAIYQDPSQAIIGPIRSLRLYYLQWDTPFDCTIVHAGGADDALAAVRNGGYRDLSENYTYMYRGNKGVRRWNNLFTTAAYLKQFGADKGYSTSDVKGFARMTPSEALIDRVDKLALSKLSIFEASSLDTSVLEPKISEIILDFAGSATFDVTYNYDVAKNSYLRSYGNGEKHEVYDCGVSDLGEKNPEDVCSLTQMAPKVVVAMMVAEKKAWDNYHEDITAVGSGTAYIFQNGYAVKGTWVKNSVEEQLKFLDDSGSEIYLAPGQTIVSAVPNYGKVSY